MLRNDGVVRPDRRVSESFPDVLLVLVSVGGVVRVAGLFLDGLLDYVGDIFGFEAGAGDGENLDLLVAIQMLKPLRSVILGTLESGEVTATVGIIYAKDLVDDEPSQGPGGDEVGHGPAVRHHFVVTQVLTGRAGSRWGESPVDGLDGKAGEEPESPVETEQTSFLARNFPQHLRKALGTKNRNEAETGSDRNNRNNRRNKNSFNSGVDQET